MVVFSPTICAYPQAKRRTEKTLAEEVADSGFCEDGFLRHLAHQQLRYTVALKMVRPLQHRPVSATWWPLQDTDEAGKPATKVPGIELCEFEYQSDRWDKPRRVIGICQQIKLRDQAKART